MQLLRFLAALSMLALGLASATIASPAPSTYIARSCTNSTAEPLLLSEKKTGFGSCIDPARRVAIKRGWIRLESYGEQLFTVRLQCTDAARSLVAFNGRDETQAVLVSANQPLRTARLLVDLSPETCGMFPVATKDESVALCRAIAGTWKIDSRTCETPCAKETDGICVDAKPLSAYPRRHPA